MFKTRKARLLMCGAGLLFTSLVGGTILSSCTSSSTTSTYAPYTALYLNNDTSSPFRYQTKNGEVAYYTGTSTLFGVENQNTYLSKSTIKTIYTNKAKARVKEVLGETTWSTIKTLYGATGDNISNSTWDDYSKTTLPTYFYGVAPTSDMVAIANIYNKLNVLTTVFQQISNLSNNLLFYLAQTSIGTLTGSNTIDINKIKDNLVSSSGNSSTINQIGLQLLAGKGISFGVGNNIYQLWPTGFTANITYSGTTPTNTNATSNSNGLMSATNTVKGDINAPYNLVTYTSSSSSTNLPTSESYKISVTNISLTYQWFKTSRSGGSNITNYEAVNNALTVDQKAGLSKMGITNGKVTSLAYKLSFNDMEFDVVPEYSTYQDPFYKGLFDSVSTGLFDVKAPLKLSSSNNINYSEIYPSDLQTKIGNNSSTTINWRGLVNSLSNFSSSNYSKYLPTNVVNIIMAFLNKNKDNTLKNLPYYQSNLSYVNDTSLAPYRVKIDNSIWSSFNTSQILNIFQMIINNSVIFNNINNLSKQNYLDLYALGWLTNNTSNTTTITSIEAYKTMKKKLNFNSTSSTISSDLLLDSTYTTGVSTFYKLLNIKSAATTSGYQFNSNSITTVQSVYLSYFDRKLWR